MGKYGDTDHTPKTLLASSIPELKTNPEAIDVDLLCDEESAAGGSGILWVELVLCVSLKEGSLSYAGVAHDDDLAVDAMVVGVHWVGGPPRRRERGTAIYRLPSSTTAHTCLLWHTLSELVRSGSALTL